MDRLDLRIHNGHRGPPTRDRLGRKQDRILVRKQEVWLPDGRHYMRMQYADGADETEAKKTIPKGERPKQVVKKVLYDARWDDGDDQAYQESSVSGGHQDTSVVGSGHGAGEIGSDEPTYAGEPEDEPLEADAYSQKGPSSHSLTSSSHRSHAHARVSNVEPRYQQSNAGDSQIFRKPVPSVHSNSGVQKKHVVDWLMSDPSSNYDQATHEKTDQRNYSHYDHVSQVGNRAPSVAPSQRSRASKTRTHEEVASDNGKYGRISKEQPDLRSRVPASASSQDDNVDARSYMSGKSASSKKSASGSLTNKRLAELRAEHSASSDRPSPSPAQDEDSDQEDDNASVAYSITPSESASNVGSSIAGSCHTRSKKGSLAGNSDIGSRNSRPSASPDVIDDQQYREYVNTEVSRKPSGSGSSQIGSDTGSRAGSSRAGSVFSHKSGGSGCAPSSVTSISNNSRTNGGTKNSQAGSVLGKNSGSKIIGDTNYAPPPASNVSGTSRTSTNTKTSQANSESSKKSGGGGGSNINYKPPSVTSVSGSSRVAASTQASKTPNGTNKSSSASTVSSIPPSTVTSSGSFWVTTSSTKSKPASTANGLEPAAPAGTTTGLSGSTKQNSGVKTAPTKPKANTTRGKGKVKVTKGGWVR